MLTPIESVTPRHQVRIRTGSTTTSWMYVDRVSDQGEVVSLLLNGGDLTYAAPRGRHVDARLPLDVEPVVVVMSGHDGVARDLLARLRASQSGDPLAGEAADEIEDLLALLGSRTTNEVRRAATALLRRLDNMTTEEFSHGGEKVETEALKATLGLDPDGCLEPLEAPPFGLPREARS